MRIFSKFRAPHFCTVFSTICGTVVKKKMSQWARFQGFWDLLAHFEVEEARNFGSEYVSQNSRVLPRVVCLCGAVGVCGECHGVK